MAKRKRDEENGRDEKHCVFKMSEKDEYMVLKGDPNGSSDLEPYFCLWTSFLGRTESKALYDQCMPGGDFGINWQIQQMPLRDGSLVALPRKTAFLSPIEGLFFRYSSMVSHAQNMPPALQDLMYRVGEQVGTKFNAAFMNLYENGNNYIGFHSDNETGAAGGMVKHGKIASLSIYEESGGWRRFELLHKMHNRKLGNAEEKKQRSKRGEYLSCRLMDGSLALMGEYTQDWFVHRVPKESEKKQCKGRINITFRTFNV